MFLPMSEEQRMAGKITLLGLPELYTTKEITDLLGIPLDRIRFYKDNVLELMRERGFCVLEREI